MLHNTFIDTFTKIFIFIQLIRPILQCDAVEIENSQSHADSFSCNSNSESAEGVKFIQSLSTKNLFLFQLKLSQSQYYSIAETPTVYQNMNNDEKEKKNGRPRFRCIGLMYR